MAIPKAIKKARLNCPACDHEKSTVILTVALDHVTWRIHRCLSCGHEWHTSEIEDEPFESLNRLKREKNHA